jgi:hypothetical protein
MPNSLDLGLVLGFMRRALRDKTEIIYSGVAEDTLRLMATAGVISVPPNARDFGIHSTMRRDDPVARLIVEAFHHLLHNGMVTRAPDPPNFPGSSNINNFVVTERGREWAAGQEPVPEDARRYVEVLSSLVPNLDAIVRQYVEESLIAYERQAYFAAAVMIGAACEMVVYLLADSLTKALHAPSEKKKLSEAMQYRSLAKLFEAIQEILEKKKKAIPYSVSEGTEQHLLSFFEAIRVQRNEAVHPNAALVTPSKVQLSFASFPHACQMAYRLMDWLKSNPI